MHTDEFVGGADAATVQRLYAAACALHLPSCDPAAGLRQFETALRALVYDKGPRELKSAISALVSQNSQRGAIGLVFEVADEVLLKRIFDTVARVATLTEFRLALLVGTQAAAAGGGDCAAFAMGVTALIESQYSHWILLADQEDLGELEVWL
jgi:hypothetical protein